jgi:hypothetical protein
MPDVRELLGSIGTRTLSRALSLAYVNGGHAVIHRGISFSVVEMTLPHGWKWTVRKGHTISAGVCATRNEAVRQAQTFIDAIMDWRAA